MYSYRGNGNLVPGLKCRFGKIVFRHFAQKTTMKYTKKKCSMAPIAPFPISHNWTWGDSTTASNYVYCVFTGGFGGGGGILHMVIYSHMGTCVADG